MNIFGFTQSDAIKGLIVCFFWGLIFGFSMGLIRYMIWGANEPPFKL